MSQRKQDYTITIPVEKYSWKKLLLNLLAGMFLRNLLNGEF